MLAHHSRMSTGSDETEVHMVRPSVHKMAAFLDLKHQSRAYIGEGNLVSS